MDSSSSRQIADRVLFLARSMGLVFLLGWIAWFWPFDDLLDRQGTPFGADFSMFYVAGQIAADGDWEHLYDQTEHQRRLHQLFPGLAPGFCLPFRYPPVVALAMSSLARLPYAMAWGLFTLLSATAAFGALRWLGRGACVRPFPSVRTSPGIARGSWRKTALWASIGWPVLLEVLIGGQASLLALLIAVASSVLLANGRPVAAGATVALSAYKPNVLALFAIGITIRYPRVILGAIPVLAAFLALSSLSGTERLAEYGSLTRNLASQSWDVETPYWKVHSLTPWFELVLPGQGRLMAFGTGLAATIAIGIWWRGEASQQSVQNGAAQPAADRLLQALALLLVVNALGNPYTPMYDLALLLAAAWFTAESLAQRDATFRPSLNPLAVQGLLAGLFFGPHLSQGLAKPLGVQMFPPLLMAMTMWVCVYWHCCAAKTQNGLRKSTE